ncbi:polysaccharide biosynthesis C-terminal domain-containing protein [Taibaiella soli]|uniref:Uncharacterized protein n=1 Tax=Taibaiella soli TaxID=1649169 RepID=A0A2W2AI18_9BACT|nr:oligosaccharide flippase family protein [Taibaiella soli]PZF73212.1 hypothetical protein DN068_10100 [Taibaiella soli]
MGIVFRQSIKTTIVTFVGALLGALTIFFSTYIFKDDLQKLGFTRTFINIAAIVQFVILGGVGPLIQTYTQRYPEKGDLRRKTLITVCSMVPLLALFLFYIPYHFLKTEITHFYQQEDQPYITRYYYLMVPLVLAWAFMTLYESYLVAMHKVAAASLMREVILRLLNLIVLFLFYLKLFSFDTFVLLSIGIYFIPSLILLVVSVRTKGFGYSFQFNSFTKADYKELAHFAWYHLLMGVPFFVMGFSDSLMLAMLDKSGMASVPIYTNAVFITTIMTIPYRAMSVAAFPTLNQAYIENDSAKVNDLFHRSGINILIVAVAMFLIIGGNLPNAVAILPAGKGYEAITPLVLILMIGRLIDMGTGLNNELISISKLYKFNFRISVLLVVLMLSLNWLWIPKYSFYGAAWASTIALAIFNIAKVIFLWVKMKLHPFTNRSWLVLLAGAVTAIAAFGIPHFRNIWADIFVRTTVVIIIYTALLIYFKPSPDLSNYLGSIRKNKRLF